MSCSITDNSRMPKDLPASGSLTDDVLRPLVDDGGSDVAAYNKELEQRGNPKWHHVAWLYAECYLYR